MSKVDFFDQSPKGEILHAALLLMANYPLYMFTIPEIARTAEMSVPRLRYHYSDIDEIVIELVKAWGASGKHVTTSYLSKHLGADPEKLLLRMVDATFLWKKNYPLFSKITNAINHLSSAKPEIRSVQKKITDEGYQRIKGLLTQTSVKKNHVNNLATSIHMMLIGGLIYDLSIKSGNDINVEASIKSSISALIAEFSG